MDITAQKQIGRCLRRLREEQGLKQTILAERMGAPQSFISKIESGERALRVSSLFAYSDALGMSVDFVVSQIANELKV